MLKSRREYEAKVTARGAGPSPMQFKRVLSVKDAKGVLARSQGRRGRRRRRVSFKGTHASGSRLATFLLKYFAVWALGTGDRGQGGQKNVGVAVGTGRQGTSDRPGRK